MGKKEPFYCSCVRFMASRSIFMVAIRTKSSGVVLNTRHPMRVAELYFSISPRKPCGLTCRPCV